MVRGDRIIPVFFDPYLCPPPSRVKEEDTARQNGNVVRFFYLGFFVQQDIYRYMDCSDFHNGCARPKITVSFRW